VVPFKAIFKPEIGFSNGTKAWRLQSLTSYFRSVYGATSLRRPERFSPKYLSG